MLRRRALYDDLEALRLGEATQKPVGSAYLDASPALQVLVPDAQGKLTPIPAAEMLICHLEDIPGEVDWRRPPTTKEYAGQTLPIQVAVDPHNGRIAFPTGVVPTDLAVSYTYGFPADIGGGPYTRLETLAFDAGAGVFSATVAQRSGGDHTQLADAIAWAGATEPAGVITILDSATYAEAILIAMTAGRSLVIQAADGQRPLLRLQDAGGVAQALIAHRRRRRLHGAHAQRLWIEGGVNAQTGSLELLRVLHCTLVRLARRCRGGRRCCPPSRASWRLAQIPISRAGFGALDLRRCTGGGQRRLTASDSIIDAFDPANVAYAVNNGITPARLPLSAVALFTARQAPSVRFDLRKYHLWAGAGGAPAAGCSRFSFWGRLARCGATAVSLTRRWLPERHARDKLSMT